MSRADQPVGTDVTGQFEEFLVVLVLAFGQGDGLGGRLGFRLADDGDIGLKGGQLAFGFQLEHCIVEHTPKLFQAV